VLQTLLHKCGSAEVQDIMAHSLRITEVKANFVVKKRLSWHMRDRRGTTREERGERREERKITGIC